MINESPPQAVSSPIGSIKTIAAAPDFNLIGRLLIGPAAALLFCSMPLGLELIQQRALAIAIFMVINWIAEPFDHGLTALVGCYLYWALHVAKFSTAFSGFTNSTIWFLFCSLLMAEAATRTGLAKRLGFLFMRWMGASCSRLQAGFVVLTFILALIVPSSMGRLSLFASLILGLIKAAGLDQRGNFCRGLFVTTTIISALVDVMVLSGATSMMTRGIVEEQTGVQLLWSQWLFACLPLNLLTMAATIAMIRWFYPAETKELRGGSEYFTKTLAEIGPWNGAEKKALSWFILAIGLWATDSLHHINPAVIGMGVGLALSLPKIGVLDSKAVKQINFMVIIFSASAISMGAVLADTRVLPLLTGRLMGLLLPFGGNVFAYTAILYLAAFAYHFIFANRQTMLITSLPLLLTFATAHGLNVIPLALLWTIGGGGGLFVYQSGVYVLGYSYGCFEAKDFFKVGLFLTVVQAVLMMFLVPYYWPMIGLNWIK